VARLTVLINDDYLTEPIRSWVDSRSSSGLVQHRGWDWLSYLLGCPWCVSMWVGFGASAVVYNWHEYGVVQWALLALSASYVTGYLAEIKSKLEES
jgi:hypothetical protein